MPVRVRLTVVFAVVMAVVLAAAGLFVHQRLASNLDRGIDSTLRARTGDVTALAQQSDAGLREARLSRAIGQNAQLAQVLDRRGRVVDGTPGLRSPLIGRRALAAAPRRVTTIDRSLRGYGPIRVLAVPVQAQGQRLVVVVGQSLQERNRALSELGSLLELGGPLALLLASSAGFALIGAALRPVEAMRRRAAAISASQLASRLPPSGGNDELGRLGRTLNEMLARIESSVARERTFVSDASHELRTPLAMVRTELELISRDRPTGPALQQAVHSAIEETDRLTRLADDLLLLTRADHGNSALRAETVGAGSLLETARRRAERRRAPGGTQVTVGGPSREELVRADPARVGQALDNLLDNALRYANTEVRLNARAGDGFVELHVLDDGGGFPHEFLPNAWERFARAELGRTEEGSGLGLSIVRTIAELHGGAADVQNRPDGGADVWISLPRAGTDGGPA